MVFNFYFSVLLKIKGKFEFFGEFSSIKNMYQKYEEMLIKKIMEINKIKDKNKINKNNQIKK